MFNFKKRCRLCGNKDLESNLEIVYDQYKDSYFHLSCMKEIICEPEKFTPSQIDAALYIQENLLERRRRHKEEQKSRQERIKRAQTVLHDGEVA